MSGEDAPRLYCLYLENLIVLEIKTNKHMNRTEPNRTETNKLVAITL
jgi:hypothetical protein